MPRCASWFGCFFFALSAYSLPAFAQGPASTGNPHPRYGTRPPVAAGDWNVFSGIEVTPDQAARISAAFRAHQPQLYLLFERGRHPSRRVVMADSIAQLQRVQLADMRAVLNPAQQLKFDANVTAILARARQLRASASTNR